MPLKWQPQFGSANELRNLWWAIKPYAPFHGLLKSQKNAIQIQYDLFNRYLFAVNEVEMQIITIVKNDAEFDIH